MGAIDISRKAYLAILKDALKDNDRTEHWLILINMSVSELSFFLSTSHECSYLKDHEAASLVADPTIRLETAAYSELIQLGFRRSGGMAYRPHCGACQACVAIRIPVVSFHPSRGQRRIWKKNTDLELTSLPLEFHEEHYQLYQRYQSARHTAAAWTPMIVINT